MIKLFLGSPVLLYGSETWSIGACENSHLNSFSAPVLRMIMGHHAGVQPDAKTPNTIIWSRAKVIRVQSCKQSDLRGYQCSLEKTLRKDARYLVAENGHYRDLRLPGRTHAWHSSSRDPLGWRRTFAVAKRHLRVCSQ